METIDWSDAPEWDGSGLPPVGEVCEANFVVGEVCEANFVGSWVPFELRYYGEQYVIFKTQFEVQRTRHDFDTCGVKFRHVRTPEQIAAEEREKGISAIYAILNNMSRDLKEEKKTPQPCGTQATVSR